MIGDDAGSVADVLKKAAAAAGAESVTVTGFIRVKCGETELASAPAPAQA
jgi:hypothetical protein